MRNNNEEKNQDEKLLSLVPTVLQSISHYEPEVITRSCNFLKKAYVDLSDHGEFDDENYRKSWKEHIYDLEEIAESFAGYNADQIQVALNIAIKVLQKHKSKMTGKEATNE